MDRKPRLRGERRRHAIHRYVPFVQRFRQRHQRADHQKRDHRQRYSPARSRAHRRAEKLFRPLAARQRFRSLADQSLCRSAGLQPDRQRPAKPSRFQRNRRGRLFARRAGRRTTHRGRREERVLPRRGRRTFPRTAPPAVRFLGKRRGARPDPAPRPGRKNELPDLLAASGGLQLSRLHADLKRRPLPRLQRRGVALCGRRAGDPARPGPDESRLYSGRSEEPLPVGGKERRRRNKTAPLVRPSRDA